MPLPDNDRLEVHFVDYSDDRYIVDVPVTTGDNATLDDLANAFDGVSLNTLVLSVENAKAIRLLGSSVPPTNQQAQNELLWRVTVKDDASGEFSTFLIPGADIALLATNSNEADPTAPAVIELVTRIELAVAGESGNAVTVQSIRITGG